MPKKKHPDILKAFEKLDPPEREELMFRLAERFELPIGWSRPRFVIAECPGIVQTPNVCGGAARLIRTRIPVWTLERMRQLGVSEVDILRSYPSLKAVDLTQAWSYASAHRDEIEKEIRENEGE
jgi:uncharacterized protein (DUF433 family)